jgi:hypothetical protein
LIILLLAVVEEQVAAGEVTKLVVEAEVLAVLEPEQLFL